MILHKSSVVKDGKNVTYVYSVLGPDEEWKDIYFDLPISISIQAKFLSTIPIHMAYAPKGKKAVAAALDEYYSLLQKEGFDSREIRKADFQFYKRAVMLLLILKAQGKNDERINERVLKESSKFLECEPQNVIKTLEAFFIKNNELRNKLTIVNMLNRRDYTRFSDVSLQDKWESRRRDFQENRKN